jgi:hypothetical protein
MALRPWNGKQVIGAWTLDQVGTTEQNCRTFVAFKFDVAFDLYGLKPWTGVQVIGVK